MARLNTTIDDPPPAPQSCPITTATSFSTIKPSNSNSQATTKTPTKSPQKKNKPVVVIDLSSSDSSSSPQSPRAPASRSRHQNTSFRKLSSPEPPKSRGRRRLVRKKLVLVDSDGDEETRRPRREENYDDDDEDSDIAVNARRPTAGVAKLLSSPSPPPLSPASQDLRLPPVAAAHKKQRFIPRSLPSRTYSSYALSGDEAEEAPSSELDLSPPPSVEGSGDSIHSHSSHDELQDGGQDEDGDEYDDSFVVGDSTIEYESEIEGDGGEGDILDLVDGFSGVSFADDRGEKGEGTGKTVGEREIMRDLEWFNEARRRGKDDRKSRKEVYGVGLSVRGRGHEEREGEGKRVDEDEEEDEDENDDEDEDSESNTSRDPSTDRSAILTYIPPTTKPLIRQRTPISIPSFPIAPPLPTTNKKKKPLHLPTHLPPSTSARNPKVLHSPTKAITLIPAATYSHPDSSTYRTPAALKYFQSKKQALADQFLLELDSRVTNNRVNERLSHLGGLKVIWSKSLLKTAGYFKCRYRRSTRVDEDGERLPGEYRVITFAQIELADKVVDDEHRLYSTLAHEFAHAANAVVGENWEQRCHGKGFKQWMLKCQKAFPEKDIESGRCHDYVISYKYEWACIGRWEDASGAWGIEDGCGYVVKRHSKSVDVEIHRCPRCVGRLLQTIPKPMRGGGGDAIGDDGRRPQGLTEYQIFMQERMKVMRRDSPGTPQKEVMKLVGLEWREKKEKGEVGLRKSDGKEKEKEKEKGKGKARMEVIEVSDDGDDNVANRLDGLRI